MGTLTLLKSRIASDLARTDLTDRIAYAISDAVSEYKGKRFHFNQARSTFSTAAGTEFYTTSTIPDDIGQIDSITLTVNGQRYQLTPWGYGFHDEIASTTTTQGQPTAWSWYAQQIRLYPIPDATYTVTLSYLQRIDLQAADGDSSVWTTEAENLIRACAEKIIYRDVLAAPQRAAAAYEAEQSAYRRLLRESHQLVSGPLAASGI